MKNIFLQLLRIRLYLERLVGIKRDISYKIFLNGRFITPNIPRSVIVYKEVFVDEFYEGLSGLSSVLDLGGFLGDTGLYIIEKNESVSIYEPEPKNFEYIKKNLAEKKGVEIFNYAVVDDPKIKEVDFSTSRDYSLGGSTTYINSQEVYKVKSIYIGDILAQKKFDGIKIDVEGAEFGIVKYFFDNEILFKKSFIEFHFYSKDPSYTEKIEIFISYYNFLAGKNYNQYIIDALTNKEFDIKCLLGKLENYSNEIFILYSGV